MFLFCFKLFFIVKMFMYLKQLITDTVFRNNPRSVDVPENRRIDIADRHHDRVVRRNPSNPSNPRARSAGCRIWSAAENSSIDVPIDFEDSDDDSRSTTTLTRRNDKSSLASTSTAEEIAESPEIDEKNDESSKEMKNCHNDFSKCENCSTIAEISECAVCLEPLQIRGVRCCPLCANVVCADCAGRIRKCAFCRIFLPMQRNRALDRLLGKMSLPCRNVRSGCTELLRSETRLKHEACCAFSSVGCPLLKGYCGWEGRPTEVIGHLKETHTLRPLNSYQIAIEVTNFHHRKVTRLRECTVYLTCYGQLFAIRVTPSETKLTLSFFQLGYVGPMSEQIATTNFGITMKVNGGCGKILKGGFTLAKFIRETRYVELDNDCFVPRCQNSDQLITTINIDVNIREMVSSTKK